MRIQIRNDAVVIDGYVNVVERDSREIREGGKTFIEKIKQGAFGKSLRRRAAVKVLLNHDTSRELANTTDGTATLREDPVGLYCRTTVSDPVVIEKAKAGKLSGWSFGFLPLSDKFSEDNTRRDIYELDLREVSILDDTKNPAYPACCIATRDDGGEMVEIRYEADEVEVENANTGDGVADRSSDEDETGDPVNRNYQYRNALLRASIH